MANMSKPYTNPLTRPSSSVTSMSRMGTPEVPIMSIREKRVANLPISKNLDNLEKTLNSLLLSISKYNPSISDAENLVKIHKELDASVQDIITHQQSGLEIDSLEARSTKLDDDTKQILQGLSECRQKLTKLPSVSRVIKEQNISRENRLKTEELLQYAMKLAKFTTAPPTFDSKLIRPDNFIWPAEDSLRRGVLAMASLNSKELIGEKDDAKDSDINAANYKTASSPKFERRGSYGGGSYENPGVAAADVIDDLDLFDPDDL